MKRLALLALFAPLLASAQEPVPPPVAPPAEEPPWNVGAGLFVSTSGVAVGTTATGSARLVVPVGRASLERRLAQGTWLVLGLSGSYTDESAEPSSQPANTRIRVDTSNSSAALSAGVRWSLASVGGVQLSGLGLLTYGYTGTALSTETTQNGTTTTTTGKSSANQFGVAGGLALEKGLTDRLALRFAVSVLRLAYASGTSLDDPINGTRSNIGGVLASIGFDPAIELRLYF
jgi:opacity protein-like surface antigen